MLIQMRFLTNKWMCLMHANRLFAKLSNETLLIESHTSLQLNFLYYWLININSFSIQKGFDYKILYADDNETFFGIILIFTKQFKIW